MGGRAKKDMAIFLSTCSFTPHKNSTGKCYCPHSTEESGSKKLDLLARSHKAHEKWNIDFTANYLDLMGGSWEEENISFLCFGRAH